jgi:hypothetical protein
VMRMQLNGAEVPPRQLMVRLGGAQPARAFQVLPQTGAGTPVWVVPPILVRRDLAIESRWSRQALIEALQGGGVTASCEGLIKFLHEAASAGWSAEWGDSGAIVGPTPAPEEDVLPVDQAKGFEFVQIFSGN